MHAPESYALWRAGGLARRATRQSLLTEAHLKKKRPLKCSGTTLRWRHFMKKLRRLRFSGLVRSDAFHDFCRLPYIRKKNVLIVVGEPRGHVMMQYGKTKIICNNLLFSQPHVHVSSSSCIKSRLLKSDTATPQSTDFGAAPLTRRHEPFRDGVLSGRKERSRQKCPTCFKPY